MSGTGRASVCQETGLAMFELRRSLPRHHGLAYSLDECKLPGSRHLRFPHGFPRALSVVLAN